MLKIKTIRESKNLTQDEVVNKTGIPKRSYVDYENEKQDISLDRLRKIAIALNVTVSELIGEYEPFKEEEKIIVAEPIPTYLKTKDPIQQNQLIPLYNLEATAGVVTLFKDSTKYEPVDYLQIPNLPKSDGALYVTGDSMYPLLKSGDIIVYKKLNNTYESIFWGEMYLISVEIAGDEITTVKWVQKSELGDHYIKLVSQNQHHQSKDVHIKQVKALAIIKASVRINSMS